jgi:hypothetical protein
VKTVNNRKFAKFKLRIKNIQEQVADKEISSIDYNEMKLRYENEIRNAEKELYQLKHGDKDFDEQVVFTIQLL